VSGRKTTALPGCCECHSVPSAQCPRNRSHFVTAKERHEATAAFLAGPHPIVQLGPEWLLCRCSQGPQPAHTAHKDLDGTL
jgi:hypothetical protein